MAGLGELRPVTPEDVRAARRVYQIKSWKGKLYASRWRSKDGPPQTNVKQAWVDQFGCLGFFSKMPIPHLRNMAVPMAKGTGWYERDVYAAAANGHLFFSPGSIKITTPTVSVYRSTGQVLAPNVMNVLTPDHIDWDNNQFWDAITHPTRLTVRSSGLYYLSWHVDYESKAQAPATVSEIRVNGVVINDNTLIGAAGVGMSNFGSMLWYFQDNDYVELASYYNPTSRNTFLRRFQLVGITPEVV